MTVRRYQTPYVQIDGGRFPIIPNGVETWAIVVWSDTLPTVEMDTNDAQHAAMLATPGVNEVTA